MKQPLNVSVDGLHDLLNPKRNQRQDDETVLSDDPRSAYYIQVTAWCSRQGTLFSHEQKAREHGATHNKCKECGTIKPKSSYCKPCAYKKSQERYNNMPEKEWNGEGMLCIFNDDQYFNDYGEVYEYAEINEVDPASLSLCICEPNIMQQIDSSIWDDILPEDSELSDVVSKEFINKLDELNEIIAAHKPISWSQGKYRTSVPTPAPEQ